MRSCRSWALSCRKLLTTRFASLPLLACRAPRATPKARFTYPQRSPIASPQRAWWWSSRALAGVLYSGRPQYVRTAER